jgi:reactive chlorine resistance protein C
MSTATRERTNEARKTVHHLGAALGNWAERVETAGRHCVRYGLVLVLLWIGGMKFTAYEAEGISAFVSNSPLMSWAYQLLSKGQFSVILGTVELLTAVLIAARPFSARLSAVGSALAVGMFLTTLTFLFSTPGVIEPSLGFPALSAVPGQFLIKDVVLLGAALWTAGEALRAVR